MKNGDILDDIFFEDEHDNISVRLIPVNKFAILSLLSFGLYPLWWSFKTWNFFKSKDNLDIWPITRAFFGIFFTYDLFENIQEFSRQNDIDEAVYSSHGFFVLYFFLNLSILSFTRFWLLFFFAFVAFLIPVWLFNRTIRLSNLYYADYQLGFNYRQWIIMILGGILFSFIMNFVFNAI